MTATDEIFDLEELNEANKDKRKLFEYLYSKQDLAKYVQVNKKKYQDKKTKEWKSFELKYLSWAYAYREMIRLDPEATYKEHTWPMIMNGEIIESYQVPYMRTETGYFVRVSVTMFGRTTSEWLAVMDSKNNAIANPTATDINKALKRCYVKALALHGLGLFLYVGEDLPEDIQAPEMADDDQKNELNQIFEELGSLINEDPARLAGIALKRLKITDEAGHSKKFKDLTVKDYQNILSFAKPQLMKAKNEAQQAQKAAEEKKAKDEQMAKQLEKMGYEQKSKPAETPANVKPQQTAQNAPQPTSTNWPGERSQNKAAAGTSQNSTKKSDDFINKYNQPAENEPTQEALFSSLSDLLDRGPIAN